MNASWPFCHYVLKAIFIIAHSLNVQVSEKNIPFCFYYSSDVYLFLLSQDGCHLLSLYTEEIHLFSKIYLLVHTVWKVSVFGVILVCIQSKCGKIQTRKTPNTGTFHAVSFTSSSEVGSFICWGPTLIMRRIFCDSKYL